MAPEDWLGDDPFVDPDDPASVERARRRREREEKRRARSGEKPQAPPDPPQQPPPAEPPAAEPPAEPAGEPEPPEPPVEPEPPAPEPPAEPGPPVEPESTAGVASDSAAEREHSVPGASHTSPPLPPVEEGVEEGSVLSGKQLPPEEQFWGPEDAEEQVTTPARAGRPRPRLLRHPGLIALAVIAVLVAVFAWALFQPFHSDGSGTPFRVEVPKGSSVSEIGDLLGDRGVISSSTLFQIRVTLAGKRSELYPGNHVMRKDMSYSAAIDALSKPPAKRVVNVTVPEGLARAQIAAIARQDGLSGDYMKRTASLRGFNPNRYGAQGRARSLEGFLFPATYEMPKNPTVNDLVERQLDAFREKISGVDMSYAKKKNLTVYDILIIASMIEDEGGPQDFRDIASVVYNRLHRGIPLGIDATVRFAVGNHDQPLTASQLATDSPYNTRLNQGLPPGPIGNPGLAAIRAATNPSRNDYLYYVTKPGSCNRLSFSSTDAQFQKDVDAYNKARAAAGGNSPTNCG